MTETTPRIEAIELHRLEVPLVRPFETSFGRETAREVLLVHVRTDRGDGWGECVAGRDPFYSGEYVDGAASVIERYLAAKLFAAWAVYEDDDGIAAVRKFVRAAYLRLREEMEILSGIMKHARSVGLASGGRT